MKVLVVEDDPNLRDLWSQVLEAQGHEITEMDSEAGAIRELQVSGYDLVLLDLCINGRNSLGVATLATYRNASCKVVVVSGASGYSRKKLFAMSPAVAATLRKPVDIEDLVDVCETIFDGGRTLHVVSMGGSAVEFRP